MAVEAYDADPAGLPAVLAAVEGQYRCHATLNRVAQVREEHDGKIVWNGLVLVLDLRYHPTAKTAYGWSDPVPGSDHRRFYAVLHQGPVDSPEAAVRAAIVNEYRQARGE